MVQSKNKITSAPLCSKACDVDGIKVEQSLSRRGNPRQKTFEDDGLRPEKCSFLRLRVRIWQLHLSAPALFALAQPCHRKPRSNTHAKAGRGFVTWFYMLSWPQYMHYIIDQVKDIALSAFAFAWKLRKEIGQMCRKHRRRETESSGSIWSGFA